MYVNYTSIKLEGEKKENSLREFKPLLWESHTEGSRGDNMAQPKVSRTELVFFLFIMLSSHDQDVQKEDEAIITFKTEFSLFEGLGGGNEIL